MLGKPRSSIGFRWAKSFPLFQQLDLMLKQCSTTILSFKFGI
nr:hypothetical protein Iba_scaffold255917CG0010 [Ipomoea batatas]